MRILLIEDNPADSLLVRALLRRRSPDSVVEVAATLGAATQLLAKETFDAAVVDLALPDGSGLDAVARVRSDAPALPIVVLTGLDDEKTAVEAVRRGAQDYLVKGFRDGDVLWRSLQYAIARHERIHELATVQEETVRDVRRHLELLEREQQILRRLIAPQAPTRRLAGRYALERPLGQGVTGAAWLAQDDILSRRVCVKIFRAQKDPDAMRRFGREARLAAGLEHPNVVRVYDFGYDGDEPFLVMEYASGGSLADMLAAQGRIEPPDAARLMDAILAGLENVHRHGLLHRDLKPANILLAEGVPKLADFGLAIASLRTGAFDTQEGLPAPPASCGTPAYMSPEAAIGAPLDARSDLHSVGAMLYHLLVGRPPLDLTNLDAAAARRAIVEQEPEPADVPGAEPLLHIARQALAKEPDARPATAAQMRAMIARAAAAR